MSGAGENRWQRRSAQLSNRQQQQQSSRDRSSTPRHGDAGRNQSISSFSGNAWGASSDRGRSGSAARPSGQSHGGFQGSGTPASGAQGSTPGSGNQGSPQAALVEEQHVPVNGYNASEAREFLKKCYQETSSIGMDGKIPVWKPQGDSAPARTSGPWGSKPTQMASGQDFWVQLRKQIASLEQGKVV